MAETLSQYQRDALIGALVRQITNLPDEELWRICKGDESSASQRADEEPEFIDPGPLPGIVPDPPLRLIPEPASPAKRSARKGK